MPIFFGFSVFSFLQVLFIDRCAICPAGHSCLFTGADCYLQVLYKVQSWRNWEKRRGGGREREGEEEEVYMKMGGDEGGVAVISGSNKANDPTYMEIGD